METKMSSENEALLAEMLNLLTKHEEKLNEARAAYEAAKKKHLEQQDKPVPFVPDDVLGKWGSHKRFGRVLCISDTVNTFGDVDCAFIPAKQTESGWTHRAWIAAKSITWDPEVLETVADFNTAPEGTIVQTDESIFRIKDSGWWKGSYASEDFTARDMSVSAPWTVIRWGEGDSVA